MKAGDQHTQTGNDLGASLGGLTTEDFLGESGSLEYPMPWAAPGGWAMLAVQLAVGLLYFLAFLWSRGLMALP